MSKIYKKYSPKILVVLLFQLWILTFSVFLINSNLTIFSGGTGKSINQKESVDSAYVTHVPICILSDADFAPFPGTGTPGDPKIIANYEIITDTDSLVYIQDTTLHFILRDNHLAYTTAYDMDGIGLHNVKNGVIENNTIEHSQHGIFLIDSENVSIYKNQIYDSYGSGIRLLSIDGKVNVTHNSIDGVGYHGNGIWLDQHCQELKIEYNTVYNIPYGNGIFIDGRDWTTPVDPYPIPAPPAPNYQLDHEISHNEVYDCQNGIMLFVDNKSLGTYSGNSIFSNYIHDNSQDGFCTNHHFQIEFYNNILTNNGLHGAYFDDGLFDTQIFNNTFSYNDYGLSVNSINYDSQYNDFINNTFLSNNYGLSFEGIAIMNLISNNRIEDSNYSIDFNGNAGQNNITFNTIRENTNGILFHLNSTENEVCNNTIISSGFYGLSFESDTSDCLTQWNTFIGNNEGSGSQVYDNGTSNEISYNYYDDWTEPDDNSDGFVDFPYMIDGDVGNFDPFPLADPVSVVEEHYLTQVLLLSPNGGEIINDSVLIVWTEAVDSWFFIVFYTLYYSSNGGVDWIEIATDLDETSYLWDTVSAPKTSTYLIRVNATSLGNLKNNDVSNGFFTLQAHTISIPTVLAPNGGELVNDSVLISWIESVDSWSYDYSYSIETSSDGGTIWQLLVSDLEVTYYLWDTVEAPKSSTYLVRVNATSEDNLTSSDESDGFFTLQPHSVSLPTILSPNGGELINDTILISWTKSIDSWRYDISYSVEISSNGGSSWSEIASGLNETTYLWNTVSALKTSTYLVRINATSEDGLSSSDESDSTFTLNAHTLSIPTITYPSGGETLVGVIPIVWEECVDSWCCSVCYSIYYSADNGVNWVQLETDLTTLSYNWNTESVDDGDTYVVKLISHGGYNIQQEFVSETFSIDNVDEPTPTEPDPFLLYLTIGGIITGGIVVAGGTFYLLRRRTKRVPPEN